MTDYDILKRAGHSPAKAAEIALDIKRGCIYAIKWVSVIKAGK